MNCYRTLDACEDDIIDVNRLSPTGPKMPMSCAPSESTYCFRLRPKGRGPITQCRANREDCEQSVDLSRKVGEEVISECDSE